VQGGNISVTGLVYREEVEQGVYEDGWLFVVEFDDQRARQALRQGRYFTRGERLSRPDLQARIPKLRGLEDRCVALVGLGSLGASITMELARAQLGELRVLDFDLVQAGTIVRWPYGLSAVAAPKPNFLHHVLAAEYPFTRVVPFVRMLGEVSDSRRETDFNFLARMFEGVDLVIDATGELGVQQLVADAAERLNLPQLMVWATEGGRGGMVASLSIGESGCWHCLQQAIDDEQIEAPPYDPTGTIQPRGCGTRTFTGASFDLLPLVAQAARTATEMLVRSGQGDIYMCALDEGGGPPQWTTYTLERRVGCPSCGVAEAA